MPAKISLVGKRFGRLIVLEDAPSVIIGITKPCKSTRSLCACDCGNRIIIPNHNLRIGCTKSCGCWNRDVTALRNRTHGKTHTPEFVIWQNMLQRCTNPRNPAYRYYGARGIKVCEAWLRFENFLEDMGKRPLGLTLERVNNKTGNYEKSNCIWATRKVQGRNKRNNLIFTVNGITGCLSELCEAFQKNNNQVYQRLRWGWPIERALFEPFKRYSKHLCS
jgi:hypothetical protein